jgi:hypothetical protein
MGLVWNRAFAIVSVAMFIANIECIGNCAAEACGSAKAPTNSCHHHKSSSEDNIHCSNQHSEFSAPEDGLAKVNVATTAALIPVPVAPFDTELLVPFYLPQPETGSPPGISSSSPTSVLRI